MRRRTNACYERGFAHRQNSASTRGRGVPPPPPSEWGRSSGKPGAPELKSPVSVRRSISLGGVCRVEVGEWRSGYFGDCHAYITFARRHLAPHESQRAARNRASDHPGAIRGRALQRRAVDRRVAGRWSGLLRRPPPKPDAIGELAAELHAATIRPFALNLWVSTHDTATSPTTTRSRVPDSSAHNPSVIPIR